MDTLVVQRPDGTETVWKVEVARSWFARLRGLIGRPSLEQGQGLYFPGTNGVHMLFMRFPIDCVFLGDGESKTGQPVVAIKPDLRPWTGVVWFVRGARGALELPAGSAAEAGLRVGDTLRLVPGQA